MVKVAIFENMNGEMGQAEKFGEKPWALEYYSETIPKETVEDEVFSASGKYKVLAMTTFVNN